MLRRAPKEVPMEASKGHSAGLRDGSERGFWEHVSYSKRLRKGSFGVARPEGVFERVSERVPSGLASERVSGRLSRRVALVVGLEIDSSDLNGEFGPAEQTGHSWPS